MAMSVCSSHMALLMDYIKTTPRAFPKYTLRLEMFSSSNIVQYSRERKHTHIHTPSFVIFVFSLSEISLYTQTPLHVIEIYINMFQYNTQRILFDQVCMLMLEQSLACPVLDKMKSMRNRLSVIK